MLKLELLFYTVSHSHEIIADHAILHPKKEDHGGFGLTQTTETSRRNHNTRQLATSAALLRNFVTIKLLRLHAIKLAHLATCCRFWFSANVPQVGHRDQPQISFSGAPSSVLFGIYFNFNFNFFFAFFFFSPTSSPRGQVNEPSNSSFHLHECISPLVRECECAMKCSIASEMKENQSQGYTQTNK